MHVEFELTSQVLQRNYAEKFRTQQRKLRIKVDIYKENNTQNEVEKETIELKKSATKTLTTNKVEKVKVRPESCNLGCQKKFKNLIERSLKVLANIK